MGNPFQPLLNREGKLPDSNKVQLCPVGEALNYCSVRKQRVLQVVDQKSLDAMVNAARKAAAAGETEILVDADHLSHSSESDTRALGWLSNASLEARADGLYGQVDFTPPGKDAVEGRVYRYGSPEFLPSDCVDAGKRNGVTAIRPTKLAGFALTNRPNFRNFRPLKNREDDSTQPYETMTEILKILNLPEGVPEQAAVDKIKELIAAQKQKESEVEVLQNHFIDDALKRYANRLTGADDTLKESFRTMLRNNRYQALSILEAMPAKGDALVATAPLHNRATATPPTAVTGTDASTAERQMAAKVRSRAEELLQNRRVGNLSEGFERARSELSE